MTAPGISVIVPVRNGGDAFARCLAGLIALDPAPLEVLVVDDGSHDASADEARAAGACVVTVATPRGPAAARNLGAGHASGDVLFFVDADVVVRPDAIAHVARALEDLVRRRDRLVRCDTWSRELSLAVPEPGASVLASIARTDGFTFWRVRRHQNVGLPCRVGLRRTLHGAQHRRHRSRVPAATRRPADSRRPDARGHAPQALDRGLADPNRFCRARAAVERADFREGRIDDDLNLQTRARLGVAGTWLLVLCAVLAFWIPEAAWAAVALMAGLFLLDLPLWRYFARLRGARLRGGGDPLAVAAVCLQWRGVRPRCRASSAEGSARTANGASRVSGALPVAVVGAGPAGLTAALTLARAGRRTYRVRSGRARRRHRAHRDLQGLSLRHRRPPLLHQGAGGRRRCGDEMLGDEFVPRPAALAHLLRRPVLRLPAHALPNVVLEPRRPWRARAIAAQLRQGAARADAAGRELRGLGRRTVSAIGCYRTFFKTYTEKVWGIPCTEIRADWAAQRIRGLSLARRRPPCDLRRQRAPRRSSRRFTIRGSARARCGSAARNCVRQRAAEGGTEPRGRGHPSRERPGDVRRRQPQRADRARAGERRRSRACRCRRWCAR